jgi:hypothetical protein
VPEAKQAMMIVTSLVTAVAIGAFAAAPSVAAAAPGVTCHGRLASPRYTVTSTFQIDAKGAPVNFHQVTDHIFPTSQRTDDIPSMAPYTGYPLTLGLPQYAGYDGWVGTSAPNGTRGTITTWILLPRSITTTNFTAHEQQSPGAGFFWAVPCTLG